MIRTKFIGLFISIITLMSLTGCDYNTSYIEGNKNRVTENRNLDKYEHLNITGNFNITLIQDEKHMATIMCSSNLSDYIMSEVQGNTLHISVPENVLIKENKSIDINLHFNQIKSISTKGNNQINNSIEIKSDHIKLDCIGSSKLNLNVNANQLSVHLPGASSMTMQGAVNNMDIISSGAFKYDALNCEVNHYNITMNGAGNAKVKVNQTLKVQINGAGNLIYKGSPDKVISNIGGLGKVKRAD